MNGANHTQSNQSLQDPNREKRRNDYPLRQSFAHTVTTTRSMAAHAIPRTTRLNNHSIREDSTHAISEPHLTRRRDSCVQTTRSTGQQAGISMARRGVWLGRDRKTDGHLIDTSNGMVRSRVQRRRWDTTLLNAMVWDLWNVTLVTRGRPIMVHSDREPILMRPIPKEHFNLPDDPDTATTAAAPSQETTSRETTQSVAERTRVRPA